MKSDFLNFHLDALEWHQISWIYKYINKRFECLRGKSRYYLGHSRFGKYFNNS